MLILGRQEGESVMILGGVIQVKVIKEESAGLFRLGIEAPKEISVVREELFDPTADNKEEIKKAISYLQSLLISLNTPTK